MHKLSLWLFAFGLCAIMFVACKSEQRLTNGKPAKELKLKPFEYDYLTIRSKLTFSNGGKEQKVSGYIRTKKDSVIWMSMSKTNVEGLRILVTQDTLLMLDRLEKKYYAYNFKQLEEKFNFPLNFQILQSLIVGEVYWNGEVMPMPEKKSKHFIIKELIEALQVENHISRTNQKLEKISVADSKNNTLEINYDEFTDVNNQLLAHHNVSKLAYTKEGEKYEIDLELSYNRVNIPDKPISFPFKISDKYNKSE